MIESLTVFLVSALGSALGCGALMGSVLAFLRRG